MFKVIWHISLGLEVQGSDGRPGNSRRVDKSNRKRKKETNIRYYKNKTITTITN